MGLTAALGISVACNGGGDARALDDLRSASCPVDLAAATAAADAAPEDAGGVEVEVDEGSGDGGAGASPLARAGGVDVRCRQPLPLPDGVGEDVAPAEARVQILAVHDDGAVSLALPRIARELGTADFASFGRIAEEAEGTDVGELVDLGDDADVAVARVEIEGARSAVLVVAGDQMSSEQIRAVASSLLDEL